MFRTILVPLDGSPFGEQALPVATELARALGAKLVLVRSTHAPPLAGLHPTQRERKEGEEQRASAEEEEMGLSAEPWGAEQAAAEIEGVDHAEGYLQGIANGLSKEGIQIETGVPYAAAAEGILTEIGVRSADLVVMSTHGRTGLGRLLFGSIAEQVVAKSPVPVLIVRPSSLKK